MRLSDPCSHNPVRPAIAAVLVVLLWVGYSVLQTLFVLGRVSEPASAILGFIPGSLAVGVLLISGFSRQACYLRLARLSWSGSAVLVVVFAFALAAVLPLSAWRGWSWTAALLLAPASGVSQELFFRAALLPAVQFMLRRRPGFALIVHSALFGLWHIGPLFLGAPIWGVVAVMLVPFLCGIGWGCQVRRDETVIWAMIQHSLIWVIGLQFAMPG